MKKLTQYGLAILLFCLSSQVLWAQSDPIHVIDGLVFTAEQVAEIDLDQINTYKIARMGPTKAQQVYGDRGNHGAQEYYTTCLIVVGKSHLNSEAEKKAFFEARHYPTVAKVTFLPPADAEPLYGVKGKHGALLVTLK